uniref:Ketoreductase domain-containing protein n=1 Tax=Arcella intermedia TaxID=1963864 RepID=A0A6B2LFG9_9EUKA
MQTPWREMYGEGTRIAVLSKSEACREVARCIPPHGHHSAYMCDVADAAQVEETVRRIEAEMGPVGTLINCAGIARDSLLVYQKEEDMKAVMATNVFGTINMSKCVSKSMIRQRRGNIVNIGSVVGLSGDVGQSAYSASKAALVGLTRSWAKELGPKGIRVNLIAPGYIDTDMIQNISETKKSNLLKQIPLGRLGTVEDVREAVQLVLGTHYLTGQIIVLDGGLTTNSF